MDKAVYDKGMATRREVLGAEHVDRAVAAADSFNAPMQDLVTEYCWGAVWGREELSRKTRSMLNLAMLTALNREHEFKLHVRGARRPRRDDEGVGGFGIVDHGLAPGQGKASVRRLGAGRDMRERIPPLRFAVSESEVGIAGDEAAEKAPALRLVAGRGDQSAAEEDAGDIGFDDEAAAELLHQNHGRDGVAAEAAIGFGEGDGEPSEFGEGLPIGGVEAGVARGQRAAGLETVFVADEARDAVGEQRLVFAI